MYDMLGGLLPKNHCRVKACMAAVRRRRRRRRDGDGDATRPARPMSSDRFKTSVALLHGMLGIVGVAAGCVLIVIVAIAAVLGFRCVDVSTQINAVLTAFAPWGLLRRR